MAGRLTPIVWGAVGALALLGAGLPVFMARATNASVGSESLPPADRLRREIVRAAIAELGEPELDALYRDLNERHFGNDLPPMPVRWESRLSEVDTLEGGGTSTERLTKGLFGTVGDKAVILLSPSVKDDPASLRRALSHEMVHAYMYRAGEDTAQHGPSFQAVLRRLSIEGAFEGLASEPEERARLRGWIDAERARLEGEDAAQRTTPDYARFERVLADRAKLNSEIDRYNLMVLYPDGR